MKKQILFPAAILAATLSMTTSSCSNKDENPDEPSPVITYTWGTDGSIKTFDDILFNADGS